MTRPPGTRNTQWTPAQRADAIGKALAVGADKASEATGIPRRTISSWLNRERPAPELDGLIVSSRKQVADRLWEAVDVGTEAVLAGLRDPKARLGDKASALRIVAEQYALLTGGATSRTENLNINAEWQTDEYAAATPEARQQADDLMQSMLIEVMDGYTALELAGVETSGIEVDGLTARAKLNPQDASRVRYLLSHLRAERAKGTPAAKIIDDLATKQIGPGDVG